MSRSVNSILIIALSFFIAACGDPAAKSSNNAAEAIATPKTVVPPNRTELVELEKSAIEARKNKDTQFLEKFLARGFVSTGVNGRRDRAGEIAAAAASNCTIDSYSFSDEALTLLGGEAAALSLKAEIDGECDGRKLPSPVWTVTVFVREDDQWRSAYHGEVPVGNAGTGAPSTASTTPPGQVDMNALDQSTRALLSIENHTWQARQKKDERVLAAVTMLDLAYFDPLGSGRHRRPGAVGMWMDPSCKVNSYSLSQPQGDLLEPNLGLLTYRAAPTGSCGGRPLTPVWGATVFMKEMGYWKAVMIVHSPAAG